MTPMPTTIIVSAVLSAIWVEPARIDGVSAAKTKSRTLSEATSTAASRRPGTTLRARGCGARTTPIPTTMKQIAVIGDIRFGWTVPIWLGSSKKQPLIDADALTGQMLASHHCAQCDGIITGTTPATGRECRKDWRGGSDSSPSRTNAKAVLTFIVRRPGTIRLRVSTPATNRRAVPSIA